MTVDMEPYEAGETVVVRPGQLHGISQCGSEAMEYENIIFFSLCRLGIRPVHL